MKTDDLIDMLACGPDVGVVPRPALTALLPLLGGLLASTAIMLAVLGMRRDLGQAALAWAGWLAAKRLSAPGARTAWLPLYLGAPVLLIWCVAAATLLQAAPETRADLFWGSTWRYCPLLITLMSLPVFAAALRVMRGLAPTHLRQAGAAAGLASGAAAAAVYCLHCPEMSAVFVGFWYVLGMMIPAALGAMIGPRVLAW
jgi:hypothetical protein